MGLFDFLTPKQDKTTGVDALQKPDTQSTPEETSDGFVAFLKELAKYYMTFLETDFHKHKRPRRHVRTHDEKNPDFKIGLNLNKYPQFNARIWKTVIDHFRDDSLSIPKGRYRMELPTQLHDLIELHIAKIVSEETISTLISSISHKVLEIVELYPDEYDVALQRCREQAYLNIKESIVSPLLKHIEKPIKNMHLGDENTVFIMEAELAEAIRCLCEEKTEEIVKLLLAKESVEVPEALQDCLQIADVKGAISSFFEGMQYTDLYNEVFEIDRCRSIQENKDFYFYFYDIAYDGVIYPIFYIPLAVQAEGQRYVISFDSQIFVNKKALDFIAQEFNRENNRTGMVKSALDRIIYIYESQDTLLQVLNAVLDEICNVFALDGTVSLANTMPQSVRNKSVQVSNSCYLVLFDKADEALVNDYEELLNLSPDSELVKSLSQIAETFINKDPESFNASVNDGWEKEAVSDKLVCQCPIPLNSEQRCILSALQRNGNRIITVEGPPGTGKSHTITAIAFQAILENKSVLVLSDKKEALDVVEDKITSTMNSVRHDKQFQNPILRLGKARNTYADILSPSSITQIKNYHQVIRSIYPALENGIIRLSQSLKSNIQEEIQAYCDIRIEDIRELFELGTRLPADQLPVVISEALGIEDAAVQLQEFRSTFQTLKDNVWFGEDFQFSIHSDFSQNYLDELTKLIEIMDSLAEIRTPEITGKRGVELLRRVQQIVADNPHIKMRVIADFLSTYSSVLEDFKTKSVWSALLCDQRPCTTFDDFEVLLRVCASICPIVEKVQTVFAEALDNMGNLTVPSDFDWKAFEEYVGSLKRLRSPIFGFLFKGRQVRELNLAFRKAFPFLPFKQPHRSLPHLHNMVELFRYAIELKAGFVDTSASEPVYFEYILQGIRLDVCKQKDDISRLLQNYQSALAQLRQHTWMEQLQVKTFASLTTLRALAQFWSGCNQIRRSSVKGIEHILPVGVDLYERLFAVDLEGITGRLTRHKDTVQQILRFEKDIFYLRDNLTKYPRTLEAAGINPARFSTWCSNLILEMADSDFDSVVRYISLWQQIETGFKSLPSINYGNQMKLMEQLVTAQMTHILDGRVLQFYDEAKNTARTLREIIRTKRRFPKEEFIKLKEAFPCILASVRDYAEYIPLLPEIFDVVIIDEASQVSIAQAFPALLRAKKVVILGDNKQFSNIKAAQARTDVNREYMKSLETTFRRCVSTDQTKLTRLEKFNIKTSVLDFADFICNYKVQLLKHFRCYKELISYSNLFYDNSLQVMKIRGKPIDEVIRFTNLDHDGRTELVPKTNAIEADFIIGELKRHVAEGHPCSLGVITPHSNQQKLIYQKAHQLPESGDLFQRHRLKVMTFDTCQGEERDIIYYSMVATDQDDKLGYVFPSTLENVNFDGDGQIRVQRLNVGFSRAKERMHFVLSRITSSYTGAIGEALRHYESALTKARKEALPSQTDPASPMEQKVLNWLYQTKFWKEKGSSAEIIPQFPIGEYLRQLDRTYNHPKYKVDFLLLYDDGSYRHRVIVEYDGFKEHFTNLEAVNEHNYDYYQKDEDVYREKILEGYGYRFLRINRFNLGDNPITTLDQRLEKVLQKQQADDRFLSSIHSTISKLENGEMKQCPKCNRLLSKRDFYDSSLSTNYGRMCAECKGIRKPQVEEIVGSKTTCPICGLRMVVRHGKHGHFLGCTRYPYCKGAREFS